MLHGRHGRIEAEAGTEPLTVDYVRLADVRALAEQVLERYPAIDVLAHNAGGMFGERRVTEDGHDLTTQVNYFAPFLLQHLLHDRLSVSGAHIVVTSSVAHRGGRIDLDDLDFTKGRHAGSAAYNASKLAAPPTLGSADSGGRRMAQAPWRPTMLIDGIDPFT
jgi:NAD(P)-dependent dehydrogenase (short-subunit alcohol dehydrogenase family)